MSREVCSGKQYNMEYKGYTYEKIQVENWKGEINTMYLCSDNDLLQHVKTSSFTKLTLQRMKDEIDYLVENANHHVELNKLEYEATKHFLQYKYD